MALTAERFYPPYPMAQWLILFVRREHNTICFGLKSQTAPNFGHDGHP